MVFVYTQEEENEIKLVNHITDFQKSSQKSLIMMEICL